MRTTVMSSRKVASAKARRAEGVRAAAANGADAVPAAWPGTCKVPDNYTKRTTPKVRTSRGSRTALVRVRPANALPHAHPNSRPYDGASLGLRKWARTLTSRAIATKK